MIKPIELLPKGGLGNQVFGLAAGWCVGATLHRDLFINGRDLGWRGSNRSRSLELNLFNWEAYPGELTFGQSKSVLDFGDFGNRVNRNFRQRIFDLKNDTFMEDNPLNLALILGAAHDGKILTGSYINFKWLDFAYEFGFPTTFELTENYPIEVKTLSAVAVHIRLGDFLKHSDIFPILSPDYFRRALAVLDADYYDIYTDDKEMAQKMYPELLSNAARVISGDELSGPQSFSALNSYSKIVTSTSTFSSVAAWGIDKRGGHVVCPQRMLLTDDFDSRPEGWLRIHN